MAQIPLETDTFAGTEGQALSVYSANWVKDGVTYYNDCAIRGTPGVGGTQFCADHRTGRTWTNDQFAQLTVDPTTVASGRFAVAVRMVVTAGNFYAGGAFQQDAANKIYRLIRFNASTAVGLAADPANTVMAAGDIVNLQVQGTVLTLTVTRGGSNAFTPLVYDTAPDGTKLTTGSPGMIFGHSSNTTRVAGSWVAGSVVATGPPADIGPFPGTGIVDPTTRADENPLSNGGYWSPVTNTQLVSNRIQAVTNAGFSAYSVPTYAADSEVYLTVNTLPVVGNSVYLFLRLNNTSHNYYYCELYNYTGSNTFAGARLIQGLANVETVIASTPGTVTLAAGGQLGMRASGSTLRAYVNGTAILAVSNSAVTAGGVLGFNGADSTVRLSAIGGGAVAAGFPRFGIIDNCTRANETPLSNGGVWAAPTFGALQLVSNQITNTLAGISAHTTAAAASSADQELRVRLATTTVPVSTAAVNLYLRYGGGNYYIAQFGRAATGTTDWVVQFYKGVATVETALGSAGALTVVPGDELGFDVVGTTLTAYRNATVVTSLTDTAVSQVGRPMLLFISNTIAVDRVGAGPLAAVSASRTPVLLHHYATQRS